MSKKRVKMDSGPKPRKSIIRGTEPNQSDSPLTFDFLNRNWLKGISFRDFTNKLSSETMFAEYMFEIFHKIIPTIQSNWNEIVRSQGRGSWKHCHPIAEEKLDFVINIIEQIHGHKFFESQNAGPSLWQLGFTQNIRLIAIHDYTNNNLIPVFVDYHHLIHPSDHFNQPDYNRYEFCPINMYS
ncbi:hypothetical protein [Neobacillus cucumis]|uniref:hypothetical protein n=1 Tax=Neobacillus cucumis TaxID=1740721 RepID=UPI002E1A8212|nr:hypothetical protein [Neobacillus cucumis]